MALITDGQSIIDASGPGLAALKKLGWKSAGSDAKPTLAGAAVAAGGLNIPELEVDTGLLEHDTVNPDTETAGKRSTRTTGNK